MKFEDAHKEAAELIFSELVKLPFRLFCLVGIHSYWQMTATQYSKDLDQYVLTSFVKECSVCEKKIKYI